MSHLGQSVSRKWPPFNVHRLRALHEHKPFLNYFVSLRLYRLRRARNALRLFFMLWNTSALLQKCTSFVLSAMSNIRTVTRVCISPTCCFCHESRHLHCYRNVLLSSFRHEWQTSALLQKNVLHLFFLLLRNIRAVTCMYVVVAFSSLARILGECSTINSLPTHFFLLLLLFLFFVFCF